jgi:lactoylglutathione lyase
MAQNQKARLNHVAIFVKNLSISDAFYRQVIGLDSIGEPFHDGKHRWLSVGPGQSLHIIEGADQQKNYFKNNHICFSVPSVENFILLLRKEKIRWEDAAGQLYAITRRVDGVKQIWLQDPDGYWIEVNDARE